MKRPVSFEYQPECVDPSSCGLKPGTSVPVSGLSTVYVTRELFVVLIVSLERDHAVFVCCLCANSHPYYERKCVIQWKGAQIERNWIAMFAEISSWRIRSSRRYDKKLCLHKGFENNAESFRMDDFFMVHFEG